MKTHYARGGKAACGLRLDVDQRFTLRREHVTCGGCKRTVAWKKLKPAVRTTKPAQAPTPARAWDPALEAGLAMNFLILGDGIGSDEERYQRAVGHARALCRTVYEGEASTGGAPATAWPCWPPG